MKSRKFPYIQILSNIFVVGFEGQAGRRAAASCYNPLVIFVAACLGFYLLTYYISKGRGSVSLFFMLKSPTSMHP